MALLNVTGIQLANALQRGHQHWKAILSNWGNDGTGQDALSLAYTLDHPVVGVQIAHTSEVGEARIAFNTGSSTAEDINAPESSMFVRRNEPYFWRTPARITVQATPESTYQDTFFPSADPSDDDDFGGALANWDAPELHIIFFFEHVPPIREEPSGPLFLERTFQDALNFIPEAPAEFFDGACVFPIHHRKEVRLEVWNSGNLGGLNGMQARICGVVGRGNVAPTDLREFDLMSAPLVVPEGTQGPGGLRRMVNYKMANHEATWLSVHLSGIGGVVLGYLRMYAY